MFRLASALKYSMQGLYSAIRYETAFWQECLVLVIAIIAAFYITPSPIERFALIASWVLVMIVELLNSGLEALCDEVSTEFRAGIKKAKDYGSAAVLLSIIISLSIWVIILWDKFR